MKILVVNPNSNPATTQALAQAHPALVGVTNQNAPQMITTPQELEAAANSTVASALRGVKEHDPDAVIIGAFGDPGLAELQDQIAVPVVGIGTASMRAAAEGGTPFAVATTTPALDSSIRDLARRASVHDQLTTIAYTATDPLTLVADSERTLVELNAAVVDVLACGAEKVIIGGGPLTQAAVKLRNAHPGKIVIPIEAALKEVLG